MIQSEETQSVLHGRTQRYYSHNLSCKRLALLFILRKKRLLWFQLCKLVAINCLTKLTQYFCTTEAWQRRGRWNHAGSSFYPKGGWKCWQRFGKGRVSPQSTKASVNYWKLAESCVEERLVLFVQLTQLLTDILTLARARRWFPWHWLDMVRDQHLAMYWLEVSKECCV